MFLVIKNYMLFYHAVLCNHQQKFGFINETLKELLVYTLKM